MFSVVSANVNGIRAAVRRGGTAWLEAAAPSILTMQEIRGSDDHLRESLAGTAFADWHIAHAVSDKPGRNGVAVLSPIAPIAVRDQFGDFHGDGRWIEADFERPDLGGVLTVVSAYVHTGEAGTARQLEKYRFMDAMAHRFEELSARSAAGAGEALITGDLNVAHRDLDIRNWKGNRKKSGFLPEERAYFDRWFGYGWDGVPGSSGAVEHNGSMVDLGRLHGGDGPGPYTWWSWRGQAFDNDTGWRIDYQIATRGLADRSVSATVGRAATYAERWSDHAPLTVQFQ